MLYGEEKSMKGFGKKKMNKGETTGKKKDSAAHWIHQQVSRLVPKQRISKPSSLQFTPCWQSTSTSCFSSRITPTVQILCGQRSSKHWRWQAVLHNSKRCSDQNCQFIIEWTEIYSIFWKRTECHHFSVGSHREISQLNSEDLIFTLHRGKLWHYGKYIPLLQGAGWNDWCGLFLDYFLAGAGTETSWSLKWLPGNPNSDCTSTKK